MAGWEHKGGIVEITNRNSDLTSNNADFRFSREYDYNIVDTIIWCYHNISRI